MKLHENGATVTLAWCASHALDTNGAMAVTVVSVSLVELYG